MRFRTQADNDLLRELEENEVVPTSLDGLNANEEKGLLENLIANADRLDEAAWLYWLTNVRGLVRIARLELDVDWLAQMPFSDSARQMMATHSLFPLFKNGGRIVCAGLTHEAAFVARWEERIGAKILVVAPTPKELRTLRKHFA